MMNSSNLKFHREANPSLVHRLQNRANTEADRRGYTFLVDGTTESDSLTYGQLDRRSREIAVMLRRILNPGDRALLTYPPGLDFVSAFFGCLYAGVIAVPAYPPQLSRPERSLPRLQSISREAGVSAILCTEEVFDKFAMLFHSTPQLSQCPLLATDHYGLESIGQWQDPNCQPDTIAFLQYTSGSTAAPKGVAVSHGNIIHNLSAIQHCTQHDTDTVVVSWLPTYHDMGLFAGVLFPMLKGCPSYLMSPVSFLQQPVRWLRAISQFRGTNSGGPDFAYDLCVQRTTSEQSLPLDLTSWQIAFNGAEPIRHSTLENFSTMFRDCGFRRTSFYPVYGLAESTVFVSGRCLAPKNETNVPHNQPLNEGPLPTRNLAPSSRDTGSADTSNQKLAVAEPVSCGSPQFGTQVTIADPQQMVEMPAGQIGEIWVRGPSVAHGYWNQPHETQLAFQAFLADSNQGPFLRTGDLGFMREGELFVTGRIKDLIIIRGRKHYPQDIEQTVESSHREIRPKCSAAVSIPTGDGEQLAIVAEVNRRSSVGRSPRGFLDDSQWREEVDEIIANIRQAVAEEHEIQTTTISILARGSIPKTSSGKIQRHACCNAVLAGTLDSLADWTLHPVKKNGCSINDPKVTFA